MFRKPFFNALLATTYIGTLVTVMNFAGSYLREIPDNPFMPMGMLSLLTLSVALMGYLFFYQPVIMLLDGQREEAVHFFLKTVATFAIATALVITAALLTGMLNMSA